MRAQNPLSAPQPACEHRRVLGAGRSFSLVVGLNILLFSFLLLCAGFQFDKSGCLLYKSGLSFQKLGLLFHELGELFYKVG